MAKAMNQALVEVRNLKYYFPVRRGILKRKVAEVKAVDNISFEIKCGETFGLVGESGCGKTTTGRCIQRLYQPTDGKIIFEGTDISNLPENKLNSVRRRISVIFQDPYGSLNPRLNVGNIVGEPLKTHRLAKTKREYEAKIRELLFRVGLDPRVRERYPHEFSGGQRQRIAIARALAVEPSLIICDEPISALDVSIQAQIMNLLEMLQEDNKELTYLFISHDLLIIQHICDRVGVMYLGRIVELANSKDIFTNPLHPYTKALLSAVPVPDPFIEEQRAQRIILKGDVPSPINSPPGCHFHPRCLEAMERCSEEIPELRDIGNGHQVACLRI